MFIFFFFFNDTATTEIYTLSLHDALPIYRRAHRPAPHPAHAHGGARGRPPRGHPLSRREALSGAHAGARRARNRPHPPDPGAPGSHWLPRRGRSAVCRAPPGSRRLHAGAGRRASCLPAPGAARRASEADTSGERPRARMGSAVAAGHAAPARGARGGWLVSAPPSGAAFEVIVPDWPAPPAVRAAFTLRMGGVSAAPFDSLNVGAHVGDAGAAVTENRRRVRAQLRLPAEPLWLEQVHGIEVADLDMASGQAPATRPTADAAIARRAGNVCVMQVADCMPVLFAARDGRAVAAAHAGWRGLAAGVLEATVARLAV